MNINFTLFSAIYNLSHRVALLDYIAVFFAGYSQYLLVGFLLVLLFYPTNHRKKNRIMVVASLVSALVARLLVKPIILLFYQHPRPFVVLDFVHPLISTSPSESWQSFPSGHALFFFAMAATLCGYSRRLGFSYCIAALIMGIARIYVGVHWPMDIVSGMGIGLLVGWVTYTYFPHILAFVHKYPLVRRYLL